mgnify:CR=1 FL=1
MEKVLKFRKKPIVIEAWQWDGTWDDAIAIKNDIMGGEAIVSQINDGPVVFIIPTLEDGEDKCAKHVASAGDYIIKGIKGEFYPCKPDIFELTYEEVK